MLFAPSFQRIRDRQKTAVFLAVQEISGSQLTLGSGSFVSQDAYEDRACPVRLSFR